MKLKSLFLVFVFSIYIPFIQAFGQVLVGMYVREEPKNMLRYDHLNQEEVKYAKYIYKLIDFEQAENAILAAKGDSVSNRKSLIGVLVNGLNQAFFNAHEPVYGDEFSTYREDVTVFEVLGQDEIVIETFDDEGNFIQKKVLTEMDFVSVKQCMVKELHFFDKNMNLIQARIVGICPIVFQTRDDPESSMVRKRVGWFYYPYIKVHLAKNQMIDNSQSYDDFFTKMQYKATQEVENIMLPNEVELNIPFVIRLPLNVAYLEAQNHAENSDIQYTTITPTFSKPRSYAAIDTANVVSTKYIYEFIEMSEKCNSYLFYPNAEIKSYSSMNLYSLTTILFKMVENNAIKAYSPSSDYEFSTQISFDEVKQGMGGGDYSVYVEEPDGEFYEKTIEGQINTDEIERFLVKELLITCRDTVYKQVVGICPIRMYYKADDIDNESKMQKKVFWVKFEDVQSELSKYSIFDRWNENIDEMTFFDFFDRQLYCPQPLFDSEEYYDSKTGQTVYWEFEMEVPVPKKVAVDEYHRLVQKIRAQQASESELSIAATREISYILSEIDLSIEQNSSLFFPRHPIEYLNYYSLIDLLMLNLSSGKLQCYDIDYDLVYTPVNKDIVNERMGGGYETIVIINEIGEEIPRLINKEIRTDEVKMYKILTSEIAGKRKLLALCPVRTYYNPEDLDQLNPQYTEIAWFKFADIEDFLKKYYVFKSPNESKNDKTFYDFFMEGNYIDSEYFQKTVLEK